PNFKTPAGDAGGHGASLFIPRSPESDRSGPAWFRANRAYRIHTNTLQTLIWNEEFVTTKAHKGEEGRKKEGGNIVLELFKNFSF
ncbi:MAG: hypothetical protein LBH26_01375, partial [Treponema sp.]|nr:hypothetical protein [Treponema sp.]